MARDSHKLGIPSGPWETVGHPRGPLIPGNLGALAPGSVKGAVMSALFILPTTYSGVLVMTQRHIVLWAIKGSPVAFEADVHAATQREAVASFRALFPQDDVRGCYPMRSGGRFK